MASDLIRWIETRLRIPPGHHLAGQPFALQPWQRAAVEAIVAPDVHEYLLCCARKNSKSALVAMVLLAHLVGPLRVGGWRCGVLSVNRDKAGELLGQTRAIAAASDLLVPQRRGQPPKLVDRIRVQRQPMMVIGPEGEVQIESAAAGAGHASGFDLAIVDELGLIPGSARDVVAGMRSAGGAKAGSRFIALTIHRGIADSPYVDEILERRDAGEPGLVVHHFRPADDHPSPLDEAAWEAANPGLGPIKSRGRLRAEARRVMTTVADQPFFFAHDLNLPGSATAEQFIPAAEFVELERAHRPERSGPCVVGVDPGESRSITAAVAIWPAVGRCETWAALPAEPPIDERAKHDRAGTVYRRALDDGSLWLIGARAMDLAEFVRRLAAALAGEEVLAVASDSYQWDRLAGLIGEHLPGAAARRRSKTAERIADTRAARQLAAEGWLRPGTSPLLRWSVLQSEIRRRDGQPVLDRSYVRRRIDLASALAVACGQALPERDALAADAADAAAAGAPPDDSLEPMAV